VTYAERLGLPAGTPKLLQAATFFYLSHILVQGWIACSEIAVVSLLFVAAAAVLRGELRLSFHILYVPLFLYAAGSTVSAFVAPRAIHHFGEMALWAKLLLFPVALMLFRDLPRLRQLALNAFLIFGVFISGFGLVQYFLLGERDLEHRIKGPAAHVMTYSGLLLPIALIFLVLAMERKRPILWLGTAVTTLSLVLTFTRSVWIGWAGAVFILLILRKPRALIVAASLLVLFVAFSPLSIFGRMLSTFDVKQQSNLDRIRMVEAGIEIIKDYPVWGVGPANIKEVYPLYKKHDAPRFRIAHVHNNLVELWAETGVVALASYLMLLALFLRECARAWHGPQRVWAAIGVAVATSLTLAGLFEFNLGDTEVLLTLLDLFALVIAMTESEAVAVAVPSLVSS
jgi:O-antigen ligase